MKIALCVLLVLGLTGYSAGATWPVTPLLNYTADLMHNVSGGSQQTTHLMGVAHAGLSLHTDTVRWWQGGELHVEAFASHGRGMSTHVLHDMQILSNIEAGNHPLVMWALWYHQQWGRIGLRAGLQNINEDFMQQDYAEHFSLLSMHVFPTLWHNYSAPNFPHSGLGISVSLDLTEHLRILSSVYNGRVSDFGQDKYNVEWRLDPAREGILSLTEIKYDYMRHGERWGQCGLGMGYGTSEPLYHLQQRASERGNYNFYGFGKLDLVHLDKRIMGLFVQGSIAPKALNMAYGYLGIGAVADGFVLPNHTDNIGLAVAALFFQDIDPTTLEATERTETTVEGYTLLPISKHISIKPTLHVVVSRPATTIVAGSIRVLVDLF